MIAVTNILMQSDVLVGNTATSLYTVSDSLSYVVVLFYPFLALVFFL